MAEETKSQEEVVQDKHSSVSEEVKDRLESAATSVVEKANDASRPWYTRALLYILAVILGGIAFMFANFGDAILTLLESCISNLGL